MQPTALCASLKKSLILKLHSFSSTTAAPRPAEHFHTTTLSIFLGMFVVPIFPRLPYGPYCQLIKTPVGALLQMFFCGLLSGDSSCLLSRAQMVKPGKTGDFKLREINALLFPLLCLPVWLFGFANTYAELPRRESEPARGAV